MIIITEKPFDPNNFTEAVKGPENGAVVTFLGTTREETAGKKVLYLEYESYNPMASEKLHEICDEIRGEMGYQRDRDRPPSRSTRHR